MSAGHRGFIRPSLSMRQTSPGPRQHWTKANAGPWGRVRPQRSRRTNAPCGQAAPEKDGCRSANPNLLKAAFAPPPLSGAEPGVQLAWHPAPGTNSLQGVRMRKLYI